MTTFDPSTVAELYNTRYDAYGRDIRTVGWGSAADQWLRFEVLFRGIDPRGKTIIDVGCGLGDLVPFLQKHTDGDFAYLGIDVAAKLVEDARARYGGPGRDFQVGEVLSMPSLRAEICVLSGALSNKTEGIEAYAAGVMQRMFAISTEAACLNFLSKYVDYELDKNKHYVPETVFSWAKRLTRRVNLYHDYPLYEFTVQLLK